eukprot:8756783-Lingulodinium_polyedra.AAC.1
MSANTCGYSLTRSLVIKRLFFGLRCRRVWGTTTSFRQLNAWPTVAWKSFARPMAGQNGSC